MCKNHVFGGRTRVKVRTISMLNCENQLGTEGDVYNLHWMDTSYYQLSPDIRKILTLFVWLFHMGEIILCTNKSWLRTGISIITSFVHGMYVNSRSWDRDLSTLERFLLVTSSTAVQCSSSFHRLSLFVPSVPMLPLV